MKTVTVGQLRQNPSQTLAEVEAGATYRITRHNREIGRIVPPGEGPVAVGPKRRGGARTRDLDRVELTTAATIDELIDDAKGEW